MPFRWPERAGQRAALALLLTSAAACSGDAACPTLAALGFCADVIAEGLDDLSDLALTSTHLAWGDLPHGSTSGSLSVLDRASGEVTLVADRIVGGPRAVALDDIQVYWTADAGVFAAPVGGGDQITLTAEPLYAPWLAIDASTVYWTNEGDMSIWRAPRDAAAEPMLLLPGEVVPRFLARAGDHIYWVNRLSDDVRVLLRATPDGGAREELGEIPCPGDFAEVGGEVRWICQDLATGDGVLASLSLTGDTATYQPLPVPGCTGTDGCEGGFSRPEYSAGALYWSYRDGLARPWRTTILRAPASDLASYETVFELREDEIGFSARVAADDGDVYLALGAPIALIVRLAP